MDSGPHRVPRSRRRTAIVAFASAMLFAGGVALALPASAARPQCVWGSGGVTCVSWTVNEDRSVDYRWTVTDDADGRSTVAGISLYVDNQNGTYGAGYFQVRDGESGRRELDSRDLPPDVTLTHLHLTLCHGDQGECVTGERFALGQP